MNEQYTLANAVLPPSSITFFGTFPMSNTKVMEITKDGIWANPDVSVDETAKAVLDALDYQVKLLVQRAVEDEREACAEMCDLMYEWGYNGASDCAEAIRARGEK